jgi:hypothetical protein
MGLKYVIIPGVNHYGNTVTADQQKKNGLEDHE